MGAVVNREALGRWTIWPDQQITRRKVWCYITDPSGETRFNSRLLLDCVRWLHAEGVREYQLLWHPRDHEGLAADVQTRKVPVAWQK